MRTLKISVILLAVTLTFGLSGCITEEQYNDLKAQNRIQQQRIITLENELNSANLMLSSLQSKLDNCVNSKGVLGGSKDAEIAALEQAIKEQKELIEKLKNQLLKTGTPLPMGLNLKLQEFAQSSDLVEYDESKGVLKFKSDLVFKPGSAVVEGPAATSIATFCGIINSGEGTDFDIIIAGHTDDQPIKYSKAKHATNWHLSAHRAIGVLDVMLKNSVSPTRVSIRGFGEYRPVEPNKPNNSGNAANRRVEIYIVPKGS